MNETLKRLYTAIFCIVYTISMCSYSVYTLCIYYVLLTSLCLFEYHYKIDSTRKKITIVLSLIVYTMGVGYVLELIDYKHLTLSLPIVMSLFSIELFSGKPNPMLSIGTDLIGLVWICGPLFLSVVLSYPHKTHVPGIIYGIMTFVFTNDAGAYFCGKYLGKHKLYPSISPKKTWEGAIGGGIVSICCYPIVIYLWPILPPFEWKVICIISVVCGVIGDLIESMFKRDLQIKDAGDILPGHGGSLDRLDSLLYTVPFVYCYLTINGI